MKTKLNVFREFNYEHLTKNECNTRHPSLVTIFGFDDFYIVSKTDA